MNKEKFRKQNKENLIKYIEDKIEECDRNIEETKKWLEIEEVNQSAKNDLHLARIVKRNYKDLLERIKSGKYET